QRRVRALRGDAERRPGGDRRRQVTGDDHPRPDGRCRVACPGEGGLRSDAGSVGSRDREIARAGSSVPPRPRARRLRLRLTMRLWLLVAAINGALAVAAGAFGAHALQARLDAHAIQVFETGARYHMYHALAIGLAAYAIRDNAAGPAQAAAIFFLA